MDADRRHTSPELGTKDSITCSNSKIQSVGTVTSVLNPKAHRGHTGGRHTGKGSWALRAHHLTAACSLRERQYLIPQGCLLQTQAGETAWDQLKRDQGLSKMCRSARDPWRSVSQHWKDVLCQMLKAHGSSISNLEFILLAEGNDCNCFWGNRGLLNWGA